MSHPFSTPPAGTPAPQTCPSATPFSPQKRHTQSVTLASCCCQKVPAMIAANDAYPDIESESMSVAAKRHDVFLKPVLIGVRGWYFQPLKQIKSGYRAVRATCLMPRPANDR